MSSDYKSDFGRHRTRPRDAGRTTRKPDRRGASTGGRFNLRAWFQRHAEVSGDSFRRILGSPGTSILTIAVIGISLSLPAAFYVLIENVVSVSDRWEQSINLNLFLNVDTGDQAATLLAKDIRQRVDVDSVDIITREQALKEFRELSGFGDAVDLIDDNPLPAVLIVTPAATSPTGLNTLITDLSAIPSVDIAQQDRLWLERMHAILDTVRRIVTVVACLLIITVLIVVGNTIRLEIENRRHEIEVIKLVGGTDAFVRRPFLYAGFWYGVLGGCIAICLVMIALLVLDEPATRLSGLYESSASLTGLGLVASLAVLGTGACSGWFGAWLAVGRHIRDIEPV